MMMTPRYAVHRTLGVRPRDYGTRQGSYLGGAHTADEAEHAARGWTLLGYPARVVDTAAQVVLWVRP